MRYQNVSSIVSSLLMILFVYTGVNKWMDQVSFETTLRQSPLIRSFAAVIAWLLPIIELGIAGLLFFESTRRAGLYASLGVLVVFTIYIVYLLLFVDHLPCSCGGVLQYLGWRSHVLFNLMWILLALVGLRWERRNPYSIKQRE